MKIFSKVLCVFLSVLMVMYLVPNDVYAKLAVSAETIDADSIVSQEVTAVGEVVSARTASTKTIRMSDGSYRLVQYANEVHYKDEGEWLEYDNSLSLTASENVTLDNVSESEAPVFTTASNPGGLKFGQSTADKVLSFSDEGKKLEMSISGANKNSTIVPQTQTVGFEPADKLEEIITIENYSSTVTYSNVFNNAHIRYTAAGNQVKEDIIVFKKAESYVYSFDFKLTGLDAELQADGSIVFVDEDTDKIMYSIPVGYMYDYNGEESSAVSYSLAETNTGCTVTVTADAEWINDEEREFPVVIDPTIVRENGFLYQYNEIRDADAYNNANGVAYQSQFIRVGKVGSHHYSGYISLYAENGEDEAGFVLPKASVVTSAKLVLDVTDCTAPTTVYMHAVTQDWDHKVSKWTDPSVSENIVDYQIISSTSQECVFDFTSVAQKWGKTSNEQTSFYRGFRLSCDTGSAGYVRFASLNNVQSGTVRPYFIISYRDTKGLESRWSYNSQSAGGAGAGSVNLFTGNLVFVHDDITANGEILPLTVSHVYNTHQAAKQFNNSDDIYTANYSNMSVGYGFKLSVQETVVEKKLGSNNKTWYVYNDADGTELYFYNFDGGTKYISEDGYDLTIVKNQDGSYTMSDKVGNTKKFDSKGRFYEQSDLFGNKKTVVYDTSGKISSVKHTSASNVTSTQLTFTYNASGALQKITNAEDTGEYVTFAYSITYNGVADIGYAGYLRTVTYSKGSGSCTYEYNSDGRLTAAIDTVTGSKLQYVYNAAMDNGYATVETVSEYNESSAIGQTVGFVYGHETTSVRTSGNNDAYGTSDDLLTHYVFDDYGRTVSAYSTNLNCTEVYGASNATYYQKQSGDTDSVARKKQNTISKDSVSGVPAVNLLKNHNAENTSYWTDYVSGNGYTASYSDEKVFIGNKAFKLTSAQTKESGFIQRSQYVTVTEAGYYTLSAYVKSENLDANTGFYLELGDTSSRELKNDTDSDIQDGWQRITVTAYLETGSHEVKAVLEKATGTAYVDCLQLEKGNGASKYNLIENGGVIGNTAGWTATGTVYSEGRIKLTGNPSADAIVYQTIPVNKPVNTTFVLSGFAEAYSVARRVAEDEEAAPERNFDLVATLVYSDQSTEDVAVSFSTDSSALQFASGAVVSKKTDSNLVIESIKVTVHYDFNANDAYFDNICLAMEPAQTYVYDDEGNLVSASDADGNKVGAEYSEDDVDLLSYTNIIGEKFEYSYNTEIDHVLASIIKSDGNGNHVKTSYEYDAYGNVTKESLVGGYGSTYSTDSITTETVYDSYGRVQSVIDSRGKITSYDRNTATELLNYVRNANGSRIDYIYDSKERLTGIFNDRDTDGVITEKETVSYTYDGKDRLTSINNGITTYTFTYDAYGNVTSVKAGSYTLASYEYNANNGKLTETSYGNGLTVTNIYDSLDRLVEVKYTVSGTTTTAYTVSYNGDGAISKVVDNRSGITTEYEYDSLGRLIFAVEYETSSKNLILQTENKYDAFGRPLGSSYGLPGIDIGYSVEYKENSNLIQSFLQQNSNGKYYTYDALERLIGVRVVSGGETVYTESYTYVSENGNTTGLVATHTVDGVTYSYTYDDAGNITSVSENGTLRANYYYDSLGQLVQAIYYSDLYYTEEYLDICTYVYDNSGNITGVFHHYGPDIIYSENKTYGYSGTSWGDLLTSYNGTSINYDGIGNPLNWRNASSIEWFGRQMSKLVRTDGNAAGYTYNADGIRTGKTFYDANGNITGTVKYTLDGSTIVAENRNGTNIYYIYDDKGSIMGMIYGGSTYMFSKNLQGDVIGIYGPDRQLIAKYQYNAYGEITAITDANGNDISNNASHIANINPFRYRGYYYDNETGFYYLQSRYYDPEVGRFINADDISVFAVEQGSLLQYNAFAYCLNDPISRADENGMWSWPKWLKKAVAAVAVVAVVAVVAAVTVATAGVGSAAACVAVGAAKGAAVGMVTGAVTGATEGAIVHVATTGSLDGVGKAMLDGAADGALTGSITGAVGGGINSPYCFIAGTVVLTVTGKQVIESIEAGDLVWAWDETTGDVALKEVIETYENETTELVHVFINGDEIISTPAHPFYLPYEGWTTAEHLDPGDTVVLANGEYDTIDEVYHETLSEPVTVYNFNVEDYHTYYVGEDSVLVHNVCKSTQKHHIISNKNKTYTPKFKEVTDRYGLNLNKDWNIRTVTNHLGRHTKNYHDFILDNLKRIDSLANGDLGVFRSGFDELADYVVSNTHIMYK